MQRMHSGWACAAILVFASAACGQVVRPAEPTPDFYEIVPPEASPAENGLGGGLQGLGSPIDPPPQPPAEISPAPMRPLPEGERVAPPVMLEPMEPPQFFEPHPEPTGSAVAPPHAAMEGAVRPGSTTCPRICCVECEPTWTVYADALWLDRSSSNATLATTALGVETLNAEGLDFDAELGWRIGAARNDFLWGWDAEAVFFRVDGWESAALDPTAGALLVEYGGVAAVGPLQADYNSRLTNVEFNFRRRVRPWLTLLHGFRYVGLEESLSIGDTASPPNVLVSETDNDLFGYQIGGEALWLEHGRFRLASNLKVGIYGNDADGTFAAPQAAAVYDRVDDTAAFLGEIQVLAAYQLTDHWAIRGGWQGLWIDGVALAPEQGNSINVGGGTGTLDFASTPFYHGGFVGLELTW